MLTLQRLVFRLDLRELLRGRVVLPTVELVEPVLRLETSEQGQPNWTFGSDRPAQDSPTHLAVPSIGEVHLREGRVTYMDYASHKEIAATLAEVHATTMEAEQRLKVEGVGQLASTPRSSACPPVPSKTSAPIGHSPCKCNLSHLRGR